MLTPDYNICPLGNCSLQEIALSPPAVIKHESVQDERQNRPEDPTAEPCNEDSEFSNEHNCEQVQSPSGTFPQSIAQGQRYNDSGQHKMASTRVETTPENQHERTSEQSERDLHSCVEPSQSVGQTTGTD